MFTLEYSRRLISVLVPLLHSLLCICLETTRPLTTVKFPSAPSPGGTKPSPSNRLTLRIREITAYLDPKLSKESFAKAATTRSATVDSTAGTTDAIGSILPVETA